MVRRGTRIEQATLAALVLCLGGAVRAQAQSGAADVERRGRIHGGARPPAGFYEMLARDPHAFGFKHGLLERARAVRQNRQALRARGAFNLLNAQSLALAASPQAATAVSGTLRYPTFMPFFSNTSLDDGLLMDSATVQNGADTRQVDITYQDRIICGKFVDSERPTFLEMMHDHYGKALGDRYVPTPPGGSVYRD